MRIGVDASCWGNKRGFGRFTRELLEALLEIDLANDYFFFIDHHSASLDAIPARVTKIVAHTEASQIEAASADGRRSIKDILAMSGQVFRHKLDVFFFPAVYSYFPIFNRTKIVVTVHDMIADHNPELIFPNARSKFFWKAKQNVAVRQADLIATVSQYSKRQIMEYFSLPESRMRLISEAARPVFKVLPTNNGRVGVLNKYKLDGSSKFILYVGGISPHKNIGSLIESYSRLENGHKLVLVGDYKNDPFFSAYPSLKKQVDENGLQDKVLFTGFVPDEDLAYLYNAADLLVFPSLEEGFGLPAIEAMACGTPVAASNTGSLPEVLDDAGVYFDPHDTEDMSVVISRTLQNSDQLNRMREAGLARSEQFQWKKAAEDTLRIFDELY